MSRLKYSMSDAFLKKFLRLERGKRKTACRGGGGVGRREGTPVPHLCPGLPAKLLVETVSVALQRVSW